VLANLILDISDESFSPFEHLGLSLLVFWHPVVSGFQRLWFFALFDHVNGALPRR